MTGPGAFDTSNRPVVLVWEVTRACQLACDHCRGGATPGRHPDELTTAEGKRLLSAARRFGEGQPVVLSGGDPTIRDDLPELIAHGRSEGLRMALTPSGTASLTRDRLAALTDAGLSRIAFSIDSADPAVHDGYRGEPGSLEATLRAARWARDLGLRVQINTTVCARTADGLPAVADLVDRLDAVRWGVFFLVPVGRGARLEPVSPERADRLLAWLHERASDAPFAVKTTEAPQYRRVQLADRGVTPAEAASQPARPSVRAGDGFAFVDHVGRVCPSGFLPRSVGNVRETPLPELYRETPLFERLRDRDQLTGKCGACPYRSVCGGSRSRAYATAGDPLGSDPLCPYVPAGYDGPLPDRRSEP